MRLTEKPVLEVEDFSLSFRTFEKGLKEKQLKVIHQLNLSVKRGEIVAIVGASGAGKSLLANAILGILPKHAKTAGAIYYNGEQMTKKSVRRLRGKEIAYIPQSVASLDPLMKAGKQVGLTLKGKEKKEQQAALFQQVGLPEEVAERYPFELSGGMARRVLTAAALSQDIQLLIADEPTPGLDPAVLQETVHVMKGLAEQGKAILFITHDIGTARGIADRIIVINAGEVVEAAPASAFSGNGEKLTTSYGRRLWNALPQNEFRVAREKGEIPLLERGRLVASGMTFAYPGGPDLFRNLSITIAPGEIVGLSGYSGSGKTTLAKVLAGYLQPQAGRVTVAGESGFIGMKHPVQLIWQHPEQALNPRWKMKKVLAEGGEIDLSLLDRIGIRPEWLERRPSELSGGELQRFCVARALHAETKFIIADEMTTMLDAITQQQIWQLLARLVKEREIGVIAISHDEALLRKWSDRILSFEDIRFPS